MVKLVLAGVDTRTILSHSIYLADSQNSQKLKQDVGHMIMIAAASASLGW